MRLRRWCVAPLVLILLALTGCSSAPDDELSRPVRTRTVTPSGMATPLPRSLPLGRAVPTSTLVWASGSRLHVGSTTLDASPLPIDAIASTLGGILVLSGKRLWSTDLDTLHDTGLEVSGTFLVSPEGRYFGYLDRSRGRQDHSGTPLAATVVYDTMTGALVVDSTAGMGDPAKDDLENLYEHAEPRLLGYADGRIIVDTPNGDYAESLDGRKPVPVNTPTTPPDQVVTGASQLGTDTTAERVGQGYRLGPDGDDAAVLGPDDRFGLVDAGGVSHYVAIDGTGGPVVVTGLPDRMLPGPWTSASTFLAIAQEGNQGRVVGIIRCDLAAGHCRAVVSAAAAGPRPVLSSGSVAAY